MRRKGLRIAGTVSLVVAAALLLATCGYSRSDLTPLAPTAIAVKRYTVAGQLDTVNFGNNTGAVFTKIDPAEFEYALAVAPQTDGKIIAAGHSVLLGQGVIALVRYNADGSPDTFGTGGIVRTAVGTVDAVGTAIALQPDGKILVAGSTFNPSTGMTGIVLARYDANGDLDIAGFGGGQGFVSATIGPGTKTDTVSLALQPTDGSIVVAGATRTGNFVLQRYDSTGMLDTLNFGTLGTTTTPVGLTATSPAIALQSDGKIVAAGGAQSSASSPTTTVLVRYNTDGTLDTTLTLGTGMVFTDIGSGDNFANAVAVQPDDKIVAAGHANVNFAADTSDIALIRYTADGALDTTFGTGATGIVVTDLGAFDNAFSVALQPTGEIVVSGNTGSAGIPSVALLRYTAFGAPDSTFGSSGNGIVKTAATGPSIIASGNAVAIQTDGSIVVAGYD